MRFILILLASILLLTGCDGNVGPVAKAEGDQSVVVGDIVSLDASASTDRDDDTLTYLWEFESIPQDSVATIDAPQAVTTSFIPDEDGEYVVRLTVDDGEWDDEITLVITAYPYDIDSTETITVLAIHDATVIYGWQPWESIDNADTIIRTQYPNLVTGWEAGDIVVTEIEVAQENVYHPENYEVVDWDISKIQE